MNEAFLPEQVYRELMETGEDWADKKAAYDLKQDMIKAIRAECFLGQKGQCSAAEATERAYADPRYKAAIEDAAEAGRLANRAKVKYDATRSLFEARRTVEASHRAAMGHQA